MFDLNMPEIGYWPAYLALAFVTAYFILVALFLRIPGYKHVSVPAYDPPAGGSPAVAAWLFERGRLPRAMAAALVSMAAKGCVEIELTDDFVTVTQLAKEFDARLEPEEDALVRSLFTGCDYFEFNQSTPELAKAEESFRWALLNRGFFSPHLGLSIPAWTVSGLAILFTLIQGKYPATRVSGYLTVGLLMAAFCFVTAIRTLSGPIEKIASRLPGSIAPRRPWTGADTIPFVLLAVALGGVLVLAYATSTVAALLISAILVVNAAFYFALNGMTPAGRKMLAQLDDYKKFISEVDADAMSRVNPASCVPAKLDAKDAYAIAFQLNLGWGEQFVTSIAGVVEWSKGLEKTDDDPSLTE
jgi:predicted membrane protein DUF2207